MKAELFHFTSWFSTTDPEFLKNEGTKLLEGAEFEILGFLDHKFSPIGYTCLWLLGESHLAIHTFPEESKSYIELTSCTEVKLKKFVGLFENKFG